MPSAAILAGGRASRFDGRDKSALMVGGRSILDRQLTELAPMCDDVMLVIGEHASADVPPGLRLVRDRVPECGPLGGLDAALAALATTRSSSSPVTCPSSPHACSRICWRSRPRPTRS